jgi:Ca2+-binding RTX toxin-like protein
VEGEGMGNALNNKLTGNDSANLLSGGDGDDRLIGRGGSDRLSGGLGSDIFDYNRLGDSRDGKADRILDFTQGQDRIDLSSIDADSALAENQMFNFIGTAAFSGTAGELRFETVTTGKTNILADVDGDRVANMAIELDLEVSLNSADFIL